MTKEKKMKVELKSSAQPKTESHPFPEFSLLDTHLGPDEFKRLEHLPTSAKGSDTSGLECLFVHLDHLLPRDPLEIRRVLVQPQAPQPSGDIAEQCWIDFFLLVLVPRIAAVGRLAGRSTATVAVIPI